MLTANSELILLRLVTLNEGPNKNLDLGSIFFLIDIESLVWSLSTFEFEHLIGLDALTNNCLLISPLIKNLYL